MKTIILNDFPKNFAFPKIDLSNHPAMSQEIKLRGTSSWSTGPTILVNLNNDINPETKELMAVKESKVSTDLSTAPPSLKGNKMPKIPITEPLLPPKDTKSVFKKKRPVTSDKEFSDKTLKKRARNSFRVSVP